MNTTTSLLVSALVAGAVAAGTAAVLAPAPAAASSTERALAPDELADLTRAVESLRAAQAELAARLDELSLAPAPARIDAALIDERVAAAVRELLDGRPSVASGTERPAGGGQELSPEERFAGLLEGSEQEVEARWRALREAGLEDEALAWFEARADGDPRDPEARMELGRAYLMKLQSLGASPEAGRVATLADRTFDRVLELDPQHWEARFTKAVALSFWPPIFGKQAEAVQQFEILVQQQAGQATQPGFADTHLLLGNLYQQLGQQEQAQAAWQTGATLFPDHEGLSTKVQ